MVNISGDMVVGLSGSRATEYFGAFYSWRRADGSMSAAPLLLQAGRSYFNSIKWGDYSATVLDPADGLSFWTFQEYSEAGGGSPADWGTWPTKIKRNP